MNRYLIVYIISTGDPGTQYVWGTDILNALTIWASTFTRIGAPQVLSVVKVGERKSGD